MTESVPSSFDIHFSRQKIEMHRRLVNEAVSERTGVTEYADSQSGVRIVTIPVLSEQSDMHRVLTQKRVPVFPVMAMDDRNLLLQVPNDARTIHGALRFITRDVAHYSEIFTEIGQVLGRCVLNRVGVPVSQDDRTILGGIAFSVDNESVLGSNIHLLPPYAFSTELSQQDSLALISQELNRSDHVTQAIADEFVRATSQGWEHVRA